MNFQSTVAQTSKGWLFLFFFFSCLLNHLSVLAVPQLLTPQSAHPERPNIIIVFIDDMGWSDLSCFAGKQVETEHIDRLASEGIRFANFYVNSPICSPSRVALVTGQYPQRWQITSYLNHRRSNHDRGMAHWLNLSAPMLSRQLNQAGYATGHFGKWHMGGQRDVGDAPLITQYGFDRSLTNFEGLGPRILPLKDLYDGAPPKRHDLGSASLGRGPIRWLDRSIITAEFTQQAIDFIDESVASNQPFYVNVWPDDVHSPFFPPQKLRSAADGSKRELYYAVLNAMDQQLGKLFSKIREDEQLRNNTLIIVASDNGHEDGAGQSTPLRGSKTWLYEGGIRSPLIVWGPGLINQDAAGTINTESILCAMDINASLYPITHVAPPADTELDGEPLPETLLGKSLASRSKPIFWRRPPDRPGDRHEDNPDLAVRDGQWKLLVNFDGSKPQLFDLSVDMSEGKNLIKSHPDVAEKLLASIFQWNQSLPLDAAVPGFKSGGRSNAPLAENLFVNPIGEGADPWVIRDPNSPRYLWCLSEGNRAIAVHTSNQLESMGQKHIIWEAPSTGPYSKEVWAPELHFIDGRWYIYFAASDGDNANHLSYVLESKTNDPLGQYSLHGPLATGEGQDGRSPNLWAIDVTVLEHNAKQYAIWSGWDAVGTDQQYLYIAPMKSPTKLAGPRVRLCSNDDYPWEFTKYTPDSPTHDQGRGLNEAPQVFQSQGRTFVTFSCGASWLPTYKLGILELIGDDPLEPNAWKKRATPVFKGKDATIGVGHSCFVASLNGSEQWHVYHAKRDRDAGWRRTIFLQPMKTGKKGFPLLGQALAKGSATLRPQGQQAFRVHQTIKESLQGESPPGKFNYFGHHQYAKPTSHGFALGVIPDQPVNEFRSGEKLVFDNPLPADLKIAVTIDLLDRNNARDAGLLFRTTGPSIGYDAQRGYFAGLIPSTNLIIFGRTDGETWTELARQHHDIDASRKQRLSVTCKGDQFTVSLNGTAMLSVQDATYDRGTIGMRVVNTHAVFSDLECSPLSE
ncbi:MAG: hypothetical protein CBD74_01775 [Saprospirales bacterium TMED214]|nr:MAG: hypothetical protein CBD74_01775 [Saprospirales bacterium TMED214]